MPSIVVELRILADRVHAEKIDNKRLTALSIELHDIARRLEISVNEFAANIAGHRMQDGFDR